MDSEEIPCETGKHMFTIDGQQFSCCLLCGEENPWTQIIEIDPAELEPGDVVVRISDHDITGCHCDVRVTVERKR